MKDQFDKEKQLESCRIWIENDIARCTMTIDVCTEEMARNDGLYVMQMLNALPEGKRLLLVDYGNMKKETLGSREYHSKDPDFSSSYDRVAIVFSNPVQRIIASFFMGLNKTIRPSRAFSEINTAEDWLKL